MRGHIISGKIDHLNYQALVSLYLNLIILSTSWMILVPCDPSLRKAAKPATSSSPRVHRQKTSHPPEKRLLSTPLFPRARYFWVLALLGTDTHTPPLSLSLNYPPPSSRIYPVILPLTLPALTPSPPIPSIAATALIISRLERLPSSPPARPWPVRSQRSQTSPIGPGNLS